MEDHVLRSLLDDLDDIRGRGTWHISLYRRPEDSLHSLKQQVQSELAEAENIKSDDTRGKVQDSLSKLKKALSQRDEMPENGIVLFSSPQDIHVLDELPTPVPENKYHCGKTFVTEPLRGLLKSGGEYGILVIERGEASIGKLHGGSVITLSNTKSHVMGKTQAGGQSQQRFERERERQKHEFFQEVSEKCDRLLQEVDGLLIGGTSHTVGEFLDGEYLNHELRDSIIGQYNVEYANEQGLKQVASKASSEIDEEEIAEQRKIISRFFEKLRSGKAEYGREQVVKAIEYGAVDSLILTTKLDKDDIQQLRKSASQKGADVYIVEPSFEESKRFQKISNGVGALLRFKV